MGNKVGLNRFCSREKSPDFHSLRWCQTAHCIQMTDAHTAALLLPLLNMAWGENEMKELVGRVKDRRSLTSYHCRQNRHNLGKNNLIYCRVK